MTERALADSPTFAHRAIQGASSVTLVALGGLLLVLEGRVLLLLLAGVLLAVALRGVSGALASVLRMPYAAALAVVTVLLAAACGLGLYALGAGLLRQAEALLKTLPSAWQTVTDALRRQPALAQVVGPLEGNGGPAAGSGHAAAVAAGAGQVLEALGAIVVVFFLGLYGAAQPEAYPRVALMLVPPSRRGRARSILSEMGHDLARWLGGRAVAMAIVGVLVTVGLLILKIPLAWVLGAIAGLLTFIEYLGAFASAAPAMLVAFTRGPVYALWVALLFTAVHILEGYVLTPLLVRTTVRFPPGYTLAAQVVLGAVYGAMGLTFATPVMIIGTILARRLYINRRRSEKSSATSVGKEARGARATEPP